MMTNLTTVKTDAVSQSEELQAGPKFDYENILYILIGTIGVVDNWFVIVVIWKNHVMRAKLTNKLIINQSLIDMSASFVMVASCDVHYDISGLVTFWHDVYCRLWITKLLMWSFMFSSSYNLVNITLERYLEIVYPLKHKVILTKNRVIAMIIFPWTVPVFLEFLYVVPSTGLIDGQCRIFAFFPNEAVSKISGIGYIILQFYLPLCLMIYAYVKIYQALRVRVATANNQASESERRREEKMAKVRGNVLKTLITCSVFFFICWVCNETLILLPNFGYKGNVHASQFYAFTVYAVLVNSIINPFIYAARYKQFKIAAKALVCKTKTSENGESSVGSTMQTNA